MRLSDWGSIACILSFVLAAVLALIDRWPQMTSKGGPVLPKIVLGLMIIGIISAGFAVYASWYIHPKLRPISQVNQENIVPQKEKLVQSKKYYSQQDKENLTNALRDLSVILNTNGANITKKAQQISGIWSNEIRENKMPETASLIVQLNDLSNLTAVLHRALFDEDGFMKKHQVYINELSPILQIKEKPPNTIFHPIAKLQISINGFRDVLSSIGLAEKYNDKQLISSMIRDSRMALENYMNGINTFNGWLGETQNRIKVFRNSELIR